MDTLAHPFITRLLSVCESEKSLYLVLEYAHGGDLHSHLSKLGSLQVEAVRFIAAELVSALEYLHSKDIVFGGIVSLSCVFSAIDRAQPSSSLCADLKPENILIMNNGHIKLGTCLPIHHHPLPSDLNRVRCLDVQRTSVRLDL
jgi:serine/threonine protein kinase